MNAENLRKVKALILEEPRRLHMGDWLTTGTQKQLRAAGHDAPACGTIGCIAGWGALLSHLERNPKLKTFKRAAKETSSYPGHEASEFLGFDDCGDELYYDHNWPEDLALRLENSDPGTPQFAQVVADAIERYIACDGDWWRDDMRRISTDDKEAEVRNGSA